MVSQKKNIIRKQSLHFQYNGKVDGFALQKEVSDWCTAILIPELEQQFDGLGLEDNYITIDKLAIHATVDKKDWQQKIRNKLLQNLHEQLIKHKSITGKPNEQTKRPSHKTDELILFYFEKGYLPWWSKALPVENMDELLVKWIAENKTLEQKESLQQQLQKIASAHTTNRIVNLLPLQQVFIFLENIYQHQTQLVKSLAIFFKQGIEKISSSSRQKEIVRPAMQYLLISLMKKEKEPDLRNLLQLFYAEAVKHKPLINVLTPVALATPKNADPVKKEWYQILKQKKDVLSPKPEAVAVPDDINYNKAIDELKANYNKKVNEQKISTENLEGIYIENAGAVIIAAFLPMLFTKLNLFNDGAFRNAAKATLLIQYAVNGLTNAEEHQLVLPKILCGLDIELPVDSSQKLTKKEKEEADEMLAAAIEHWGIIKNTSVAGLRESFLKRSGKLSLLNNEWLLQVEQKSFDMLLQQLPWSISMIKLPWMEKLLKTEWI